MITNLIIVDNLSKQSQTKRVLTKDNFGKKHYSLRMSWILVLASKLKTYEEKISGGVTTLLL